MLRALPVDSTLIEIREFLEILRAYNFMFKYRVIIGVAPPMENE